MCIHRPSCNHAELLNRQMAQEEPLCSTLLQDRTGPIHTVYTCPIPKEAKLRCKTVKVTHIPTGDYHYQIMSFEEGVMQIEIHGDPVQKLKDIMYDVKESKDTDQAHSLSTIYSYNEEPIKRALACMACHHGYTQFLKRYSIVGK